VNLTQEKQVQLNAVCESNDSPNFPLAPGDVLQERYCIVRQLGRGGMGAVYEAIDQRLGITVALKETLSSELSLRKQFELEARLLAGMQHPALPRVSDHFVEGNRACLVMQYISGVDLATIISQQPGPFPRDRVIAWADQLLDALIYLHSRNRQVIHQDIKPHNLKLTATGQIALLDFGLARSQRSDASVSAAFFGYTRHYAPLEQIQDQRTDQRSDIYALGATLYHLLTGVKPPDALVRAAALVSYQSDPLLPANKIHEAVGPQIAAILQKAMAQDPDERYADASEFREALRRMGRIPAVGEDRHRGVAADSEVTFARAAPPAVTRTRVRRGSKSDLRKLAALVVTGAVLAGAVFYGSQGRFQSPSALIAESGANSPGVESQPILARNSARSRAAAEPPAKPEQMNSTNIRKIAELISEKKQVVPSEKLELFSRESREPRERGGQRSTREFAGNRKRSYVALTLLPNHQFGKNQRGFDAPSVRLPSPELRDNFATPANDLGSPAYGSSAAAPKFFRAADGTEIVKFSDGTTRVVRPGQRSAELK
jgi:serine/threonine protein kinase